MIKLPGLKKLSVLSGFLCLAMISFSQIPKNREKPPVSTPITQRPNSPIDLRVTKRGADYLTIGFSDSSKNEVGNRLYRSRDGIAWTLVGELGVIQFAGQFQYKDVNLQKNNLYYYKVEVYARKNPNSKGAGTMVSSFTPALKAYTGEGDSVKLYRLQVEIKTSVKPNADLDGPLRVDVGLNRGTAFPASFYTFLDYGHDDFEKGSTFAYELNIGGISSLADIGDILISNTTYNDRHIIDSIKIIANGNIVYEKSYLPAGLTLYGLGSLRLLFSDMARSEQWSQLVIKNRDPARTPSGLTLFLYERSPAIWAVKIPKAEIISRIEGIVGHSFYDNASMGDNIAWYEGSNAVTAGYRHPDTIHIGLNLKTTKLIDRKLNAYLDIAITSSCSSTGVLTLLIIPCNLTFSHNLDFLNGLTPGINLVLKTAYDLVGRAQGGSTGLDTITMNAIIPKCFDPVNVRSEFSPESDLIIILGTLGDCSR